ncbi:MAG TPA: PIG-L family deacetylase [Drouetiella sp.]|jgi:LmbE family N-acetylglucosaminyl deacetylase
MELNAGAYKNRLVVMFGFHPDDIDFHAAGLAAWLIEHEAQVIYVVVTSGDAAGKVREREREQIKSALAVGVKKVVFLQRKDGGLKTEYSNGKLDRLVANVIRRLRPSVVVTFSPSNIKTTSWGAEHPDHIYGARSVWESVYPLARSQEVLPWWLFWRKPLAGHKVEEVLWFGDELQEPNDGNCFVEVQNYWSQVEAAMSAHVSQWGDDGCAAAIAKSRARAERAAERWGRRGQVLLEEYHQVKIS